MRRAVRFAGRCIALAALALSGAAAAQAVSSSPGPEAVSVTVYRNPDRSADEAMNLRWLNGFALITETRRVSIPAGEADIRFEGVAGGIIPESAIVTGLPDGVVEKNQDAYLLSPASLLDRSLGRRVHLRRTSLATGAVREQDAIVRTGADGAVVLQTAEGFEALRCTGLPETLVYDEVPEGLSARPTLSVRTRSSRAGTATVTLSYLATGFDWQANYIATLAPSEDRLDLFAWVTLANGDETSFVEASTQTVAGRLNREEQEGRQGPSSPPLRLECWPAGRTHQIPEDAPPPPPPPPPSAMMDEAIVVTGIRASLQRAAAPAKMEAVQEELGDLKLYRIPEPVTVAAQSQKQVALLHRDDVKVESFYRLQVSPWWQEAQQVHPILIIKMRNRRQDGLGLPLPAGGVALFRDGYARPVLIGEGSTEDKAIGEDVEIEFSEPPGVVAQVVRTAGDSNSGTYRLTVSNDRSRPIRFDAEFGESGEIQVLPTSGRPKLGRRNGRPVWSIEVPANGSVVLGYELKLKR